ncbi:MAG: class I SAM-dependent methyltransferase [Actinomycetota bacterium]
MSDARRSGPHTASLAVDEIKAYWREQALRYGADPSASWTDGPMIDLEIRTIGSRLAVGDRVLDVGCAVGYSTIRYAREQGVEITGLDYVPEMIEQAERNRACESRATRDRITFRVGNALAVGEPDGAYDKVITTRVLINLGDWDNQRRALRELTRVTRRGGVMLLSEATAQGFREMNAARAEWGLVEVPLKPFNVYLDEERVLDELRTGGADVEVVDFSSSYFFGTRVLKPLLATTLGVEVPTESRWNRFFAELPSWGRMGTQRLFVVRNAG